MSGRSRSRSPSGRSRSRSNSPTSNIDRTVPIPEGIKRGDQQAQRKIISEIISDSAETKDGDAGRHLELLSKQEYQFHKKNKDGVTTRAVWLDWDGNRDKYIKKEIIPSRIADVMSGYLWRKKQGGSSLSSPWVRREFTAEMIPGVLTYIAEKNIKKTVWLVTGCILHRIEGYIYSRPCAFRIVWPSGFDLILAADDAPACAMWFEYMCAMQCPTKEIMIARKKQFGNAAHASALHAASIRSLKYRELRPHFGAHKLQFKVAQSVSDTFKSLEDEYIFAHFGQQLEFVQQLDPAGEARKWGDGYPLKRYTNLPESHYAMLPSISPYCEAWEALCTTFPKRHQEELRRFLVANQFDVEKASKALRAHIDWRAKMFPLNPELIKKELAKGKCFVHGLDHYGNPVIYYITYRQDPTTRSIEENIRAVVYRLEQAIARLPNRDGKVTVIVVREGAQAKNRDIDFVLPLSKTLQDNYPERLHACVVYPAGIVFRTSMTIAGGHGLTTETLNRLIYLTEKKDLRFYVPQHCLLDKLGGLDHYDFGQDVQKRGSPFLLPPLWVSSEAKDYYPPPYDDAAWEAPNRAAAPIVTAKPSVEYICPHCANRKCKLCRSTASADSYYDDWKPLNLDAEFPDPMV